MLDNRHGGACHNKPDRVTGNLSCARHNARRVANLLNRDDKIDIGFANRPVGSGVGHQIIGDYDHLVRHFRVGYSISKATAGRFSVLAGGISHIVRGGCGYKCNIYRGVATHNIAGTATVGAKLNRICKHSL